MEPSLFFAVSDIMDAFAKCTVKRTTHVKDWGHAKFGSNQH